MIVYPCEVLMKLAPILQHLHFRRPLLLTRTPNLLSLAASHVAGPPRADSQSMSSKKNAEIYRGRVNPQAAPRRARAARVCRRGSAS